MERLLTNNTSPGNCYRIIQHIDGNGITLDFSNLYAKINAANPSQALSDVANLYAYFKNSGSTLFTPAVQSEVIVNLSKPFTGGNSKLFAGLSAEDAGCFEEQIVNLSA